MSYELKELVSGLARTPRRPLEIEDVNRRASRLRWRDRLLGALAVVAIAGTAYAGVQFTDAGRQGADLHGPAGPGGIEPCPGQDYDITIFLTARAESDEISRLRQQVADIEGVSAIELISKKEAFEEFKAIYRERPEFYENLLPNALPASLRVWVDESTNPQRVLDQIPKSGVTDEVLLAGRTAEADVPEGVSCVPASLDSESFSEEPRREPRPTSPTVVIASGTEAGERWSLSAFTAEIQEGEAEGEHALCLDWKFGPAPHSGGECLIGGAKRPSGAHYFHRIADSIEGPRGAYIGAISKDVAAVDLSLDDGTVEEAAIYDPPPELGVDFKFFVGFTPTNVDVRVRVLDASGGLLEQEEFEALPMLTVSKTGEGSGTVLGYRTEEIECGEQAGCPTPKPHWINCGSQCAAMLDGARITLRAVPDEGSVFAGWTGACSGDSCALTVDSDMSVGAVFERE